MQMKVSGLAPFSRRWINYSVVVLTASPWRSPAVSIDIDSPLIQFLYVSRNMAVTYTSRKAWFGALCGMIPSVL